ncbi:MAG: methylenetetrahydrofolate--tRNA-(uracil(54)-C(5))-methyltransferase (FADH(2)-oxidizing) TrmFO [Deltaproteobacteria bacterium]|nr:methylenetetrahydrofolate--tRNA-(uracil(54)-C(5))-methyltransferase (FADH(2)-oxidizing) TrmFO [Deltaproteobacteria bacterium]MDL1962123.1 methylenetetrahydrofolate--tRNA-(uracil(54)-C(5))-methyltransferase (FADH(2)-oxidizing) TrmFO [Deltaproteobacteria bacterium]
MDKSITIIGGGLAGTEAAWQVADRGVGVRLYEMKPKRFSPAHKNPNLAELVCSNSLRSAAIDSAVGLLKEEMRLAGSLIMAVAHKTQVPAGKAMAVDRERFAQEITQHIEKHPLISVVREEITEIPKDGFVILATGPLTSEMLSQSIQTLIGVDYLYFYDAIAPIVMADSVNHEVVFRQSRYCPTGEGDYLNCPMDKNTYEFFVSKLLKAEKVPLHAFEKAVYFEGCLPIEVMAERGPETLRFGPMKPVGLTDPRTGQAPHAVVQLRQEDLEGSMCNMVGFQTKLKWKEQERVFRLIPGLENAEFVRLGSIHRNTFVCAPEVLEPTLQMKNESRILLAGQVSGVEGYVESTAMGWLAGINAARLIRHETPFIPPAVTAHGALIQHITQADPKRFQPMNINFGLFPRLEKKIPKRERGKVYSQRALETWKEFLGQT